MTTAPAVVLAAAQDGWTLHTGQSDVDRPRAGRRLLVVLLVLLAAGLPVAADQLRRPPPRSVFFGLSVPRDDPVVLDEAAAAAGARPTVDNFFLKLDSAGFTAARLTDLAGRGLEPMVSLEPWSYRDTWGSTERPAYRLRAIAAGGQDAALTRIAAVAAAYGGPMLLRFAHEMNGWWYPWSVGRNGNTAADYVAAWRHVHGLFRAAGADRVRFVWAPNVATGSGRETPLEQAYPGDAYVDLVGMTGYGRGPSAGATLDATYARVAALSTRDVVLAETGADGPGKAAWITSLAGWLLERPRVVGFVWFETSPESAGASGDYRFTEDPASLTAFRGLTARLPLRRGFL